LSSKYADSLAGNKKTKASRDEIAAVSILQGYLDKPSPPTPLPEGEGSELF